MVYCIHIHSNNKEILHNIEQWWELGRDILINFLCCFSIISQNNWLNEKKTSVWDWRGWSDGTSTTDMFFPRRKGERAREMNGVLWHDIGWGY